MTVRTGTPTLETMPCQDFQATGVVAMTTTQRLVVSCAVHILILHTGMMFHSSRTNKIMHSHQQATTTAVVLGKTKMKFPGWNAIGPCPAILRQDWFMS